MNEIYNVSSNPHVRSKDTTGTIMLNVIIALLPASIFGIYNFGVRAALLIAVCMISCVAFEGIYQHFMKQRVTISDLSAAVTGLLLALNLPHDFPIWMAVLGCAFAIIVVKQVFGGLGQNFMNPALAARCFLVLSFGTRMTVFTYDGVTSATPLKQLKDTGVVENLKSMFIGTTGGTIGETSAIALLIGGIFLLVKGIIDFRIPLCYLLSFTIFMGIFGDGGFSPEFLAAHLCGGGLMLGAFFMATDYVTSPITKAGRIVFGILLGILTGIFRVFGSNAEGVSFAIIFCNLLVPIIEKLTMPTAFGYKNKLFKGRKEGKK
jgi:electron transport complex protein RnfD/electron transport complex protein RnfC